MLQSHSQQTNENSLFFKDYFYSLNFVTPLIYMYTVVKAEFGWLSTTFIEKMYS